MKLFVWRNEPSWIAVAHAESVAMARGLLLGEVGGIDGSCVVRAKARKAISEDAPAIWRGHNAEFSLTDSAEVEERDAELTRLRAELARVRAELAAEREAREQIESEKRHTMHLLGQEREQSAALAAALEKYLRPFVNATCEDEWWAAVQEIADARNEKTLAGLLDATTAILAARDERLCRPLEDKILELATALEAIQANCVAGSADPRPGVARSSIIRIGEICSEQDYTTRLAARDARRDPAIMRKGAAWALRKATKDFLGYPYPLEWVAGLAATIERGEVPNE